MWAGACAGELLVRFDLDYLRSALDRKRGALARQPTKHVCTHTHELKPLNHFTAVRHLLSSLRFNTLGSYTFLALVLRSVFGNRAVILKTNWQQICDQQMLGLLLRLRTGQKMEAVMALLATRSTAVAFPNVIFLFCHQLDATDKNEEELQLLPGPSVLINAVDKAQDAADPTLARASALLNGEPKLPLDVSLRVSAVVAVQAACLASQGVPCETRCIIVRFRALWRRYNPRDRFATPMKTSQVIDVTPKVGHVVALDGVKRAATRMQVPLVLTWASTIHSA